MIATALRRAASAATIAMVGLAACQLIVPSELPEVTCAGVDPSACPSGMRCEEGRCVSGPLDPDASEEEDADVRPEAGRDADAATGLADLGASCVVDGDCNSGLCGTSTTLTTSIISASTKPICTSTCCTSADCPSSFVCFNGGTGGSYCVPAVKAGRAPPASGGKAAGAACAGDGECRSGLCEDDVCIDTCCLASDCAAGTTCRVRSVDSPPPSHLVWACAPPNAGGKDAHPDAGCSLQSDCKNDNCVGFPKTFCTPSCCSEAQCTAQSFTGNVCSYGRAGNDQLKFCTQPGSGGAALNTACADDFDCESRYCDTELRKCAQVCCTDDDCPGRMRCAPSKSGTPFLRCVP